VLTIGIVETRANKSGELISSFATKEGEDNEGELEADAMDRAGVG
jgi:hypothetical protein